MIYFDDFILPERFYKYEKHPDFKATSEENFGLYTWMVQRASYFIPKEKVYDNLDLFYFPYLRAVNAWLFSDRKNSLATFVRHQLTYFIGEAKRQSAARYKKNFHDFEMVSIDFVVDDHDATIEEILPDTRVDIERDFENGLLYDAILASIEKHEENGANPMYKRKRANVSYWTIFKLYFTDSMTLDQLKEECVKRGYISPDLDSRKLRQIVYYCRNELRKERQEWQL